MTCVQCFEMLSIIITTAGYKSIIKLIKKYLIAWIAQIERCTSVHIMSSNSTYMGADDMNMMKGQETKSGSSVAVPLPYMDSNEINKRLDEHAKLLKEWEELLNRTSIDLF